MFTRCPECRTVFHITAAELKSADGMVICGACETTFDALESLSETRPVETPVVEPVDASPVEEDAPASEPEEDARDEEEFLEEIEALISSDDETEEMPSSDDAQRVTPPAEAAHSDDVSDIEGPPAEEPPPGAGDEPEIADDDLDYDLPDPDAVFRVDDDAETEHRTTTDPFVGDDDEAPEGSSPEEPPAAGEHKAHVSKDAAAEFEDVPGRDEETAADAEHAEAMPAFVAEQRRGRLWPRILLPLVALALLGGTWIHVQRGKLLRLPAGEAVLGPIYGALGVNATPDWRPGDFRVVRSEAIANPDRPGELQVAVEFLNAAGFAQPYPLIRIVLLDRFGQRIGTHDFAPDAYLEAYRSGARLQADGRIRASVAAPDPGGRADGFRVDLCLELDARGIVCSGEPFR
jgi:predicted Zn finger-like uncharacterized protein